MPAATTTESPPPSRPVFVVSVPPYHPWAGMAGSVAEWLWGRGLRGGGECFPARDGAPLCVVGSGVPVQFLEEVQTGPLIAVLLLDNTWDRRRLEIGRFKHVIRVCVASKTRLRSQRHIVGVPENVRLLDDQQIGRKVEEAICANVASVSCWFQGPCEPSAHT